MGKWETDQDGKYSKLLLTIQGGWHRYATIFLVDGSWFLMDSPVGLMSSDLETDDLEIAQKRALKIVFARVEKIYKDVKDLIDQETKDA